MTFPAFLFALLIALLYGALYHLIRGGGFWRLMLDLGLSPIGFFLGHWVGVWRGWIFFPLGTLDLGLASLGSMLMLVLGDRARRIDLRRESKV